MDSRPGKLLDAYKRLLQLSEQQWQIVDGLRTGEKIAVFEQIEIQKQSCKTVIEQMVADEQNYRIEVENDQEQLIQCIVQTQLVHERLHQHISNWYNENSQEMKQMKNQRKTLQAYGGLNDSDVLSYYFDEKK